MPSSASRSPLPPSLSLYRALGDIYHSADTLDDLGHPYSALGQHEQARAVWREAQELYKAQGNDDAVERVRRQLDSLGQTDGQESTESAK